MFGFFRKRDHEALVQPGGRRITVKGGEKLLDAALRAGLDWPHDCRVGSCGTCRCVVREGRIKPLTDFVYTLDVADIREGAVLACQTLLKSDVEVEVSLGEGEGVPVAQVEGRIAGTTPLTHDIVEMRVSYEGDAFAQARAGQYADVIAGPVAAPRSYSFARAPALEAPGQLTFFVRHAPGGEFTDWLFGGERAGEPVRLAGPYGSFHQREGTGTMICVAGGSGLAPIHALVEDGARADLARDCVVLFGARAQRDLYHLDRLAAIGRDWKGRFEVLPVLSEEPADSDWSGARGLVTEHLAKAVGPAIASGGAQGYLCGPPPMVDAGVAALGELGLPGEAIFADRFLDASTQPGGRAAI